MKDGLTRGAVITASFFVIGAGLKLAAEVAVPIVLAVFLSFVTAPLVFSLYRRGVPHALAVLIVLAGGALSLVPLGLIARSSLIELAAQADTYQGRVAALVVQTEEWLSAVGLYRGESTEPVFDPGPAVSALGSALTGFGSFLTSGVLVLLLTAFMLFDASRLWNLVDRRFARTEGDSLLNEISHEVNRYLAVKTATSLVTGTLAAVACAVLDVDFPLLWGLTAFLLNYIPTIGSIIAAIPPVLLALVLHGPASAALLAGIYLAINFTIGNMLEPRVMGDAMGLSPAVVFLSLVVCGYLLGPVGALLSVPIAMVLKMALASRESTHWLSDAMGSNKRGAPAAPPPPQPTGRITARLKALVPDDLLPGNGEPDDADDDE